MNVVGYVLMGLGVLFFWVGLWLLSTAYASTTWPTVDGQIIETKVVARVGRVGNALQRHLEYSVEITYAYDVNQVTHRASRYALGTGDTVVGGFNEKSEARVWLKENPAFQKNQAVTVYVDSNDPTNTVLSAGINWATFVPVLVSLLFLTLGYFLRCKLVKVTNGEIKVK